MNVLVIGSGGREHAIAWKLAQSSKVEKVFVVPGNGGTAFEEKCVNINPSQCSYLKDISAEKQMAAIAKHENCQFAVVGPEDPLAAGIADSFWQAGIPVVGPCKNAAQLEASKDFAKDFMKKHGVACAQSATFTDKEEALKYIEEKGAPIVIKADGLAAGKGVVVAKTVKEAKDAVIDMMENSSLGKAGTKLVIEEYLCGIEVSILAAVSVSQETIKNGKACIIPFLSARDHKRLCDGAKGPNTGGMGAISPVSDYTKEIDEQFKKTILEPTLKGLIAENFDYRGFIFFGLMITPQGPKALEYNVRLGDPETQAVLPLMDFDFADMCMAITDGSLKDFNFTWKEGFSVAPVIVSGGYPKAYKKGCAIKVKKTDFEKTGAKLFVAGAIEDRRSNKKADANSTGLVTSGGRVLACEALAPTFDQAWNKAYEAIKAVSFDNMFYRKDIGLPGAAESN